MHLFGKKAGPKLNGSRKLLAKMNITGSPKSKTFIDFINYRLKKSMVFRPGFFFHMENYIIGELQTSVSDALVCLIVTRLLLVMVAQMDMASPGT